MRAATVSRFGGPEAVEITEHPLPVPGEGQVRVKVRAAAINPVDAAMRSGVFGGRGPVGLGFDVAGVVDAVGPGTGWKVGERVFAVVTGHHKPLGTHADHIVVDTGILAPSPVSLDRTSAIRRSGLAPSTGSRSGRRAAAAAVWARVRPLVDVPRAAVDTVAVVYVMRGAFARHHLLAEARRHLSYALRGRPHQPGLDERTVQAAVDDCTRPVGRGRRMTADLRALYRAAPRTRPCCAR